MSTDSIEANGLQISVDEAEYSTKIGPYPTAFPDSVTFVATIITFSLGSLTSGFFSAVGKDIWTKIKKAYAQRKKERLQRKTPVVPSIVGKIVFNCDGVEVVCNFDELEDIHMDTLRLVIRFIADKRNISDVMIPTQGPIEYKDRGRRKTILWSTLKKMYPT
jgi:hypothetical protein